MRIFLLLLLFVSTALAGESVREVPPGPLRAELFALARPDLEKVVRQPVKFLGSLKQSDGWAFFRGEIVDLDGRPIVVGDAESAETASLWHQKQGRWKLVCVETGFTDVIYLDWPAKYGAPVALCK